MRYYTVDISREYEIWDKHISIDRTVYIENKENTLLTIANNTALRKEIKVRALSQDGDDVFSEKFFPLDESLPYFFEIDGVILIRSDIFTEALFRELKGVNVLDIKVDGSFKHSYKAIFMVNSLNCIDCEKSVRKAMAFFSSLVLDVTKIPNDINGFFLNGWKLYDKVVTIVDEKLKEELSRLEFSDTYLSFKCVGDGNR